VCREVFFGRKHSLSLPKAASLRDAGFAAPCGGAGMWLLLNRVWLCVDLCSIHWGRGARLNGGKGRNDYAYDGVNPDPAYGDAENR